MIITGRFIAVNLRFMISWEVLVQFIIIIIYSIFFFFCSSFHFIKIQISEVYGYSVLQYKFKGPNLENALFLIFITN